VSRSAGYVRYVFAKYLIVTAVLTVIAYVLITR
jgi:hypothetical protein